jgi:hypothetical protein
MLGFLIRIETFSRDSDPEITGCEPALSLTLQNVTQITTDLV